MGLCINKKCRLSRKLLLSMNKHYIIFCFAALLLSLSSCGEFIQGMATAVSAYSGMGGYPTYSSSSSGNMDYLLDPNYAYMQTQQQMAQMNAVNQQLLNVSAQQVADAEQKEYQEARKYRPNLTLEEYRLEKAQAYQAVKGQQNTSNSKSSSPQKVSSHTQQSYSTTLRQCSHCHGTGKVPYESNSATFGTNDYRVKCSECGETHMKSTGHTHVTCPICHGKCYL